MRESTRRQWWFAPSDDGMGGCRAWARVGWHDREQSMGVGIGHRVEIKLGWLAEPWVNKLH